MGLRLEYIRPAGSALYAEATVRALRGPVQSEQQKVFDVALALRSERQSLPCLHVSEAYVHLVRVAPLAV